jgi:hypothetical protein
MLVFQPIVECSIWKFSVSGTPSMYAHIKTYLGVRLLVRICVLLRSKRTVDGQAIRHRIARSWARTQ